MYFILCFLYTLQTKANPAKTKYLRYILVRQNQSNPLIEWAEAHTVDTQQSLLPLWEIITLKYKKILFFYHILWNQNC